MFILRGAFEVIMGAMHPVLRESTRLHGRNFSLFVGSKDHHCPTASTAKSSELKQLFGGRQHSVINIRQRGYDRQLDLLHPGLPTIVKGFQGVVRSELRSTTLPDQWTAVIVIRQEKRGW